MDTITNPNSQDLILVHGARLTGAKALSPAIKEASRLQVWRGLAAILFDWGLIAGAFAAAIHFPYVPVWIAAAVVIAGRQHALLVLMHEATHYRLLHNRTWNDRLSNWFLAWPQVDTTEGFRSDHLPHHFHLFTERDPEWTRKKPRPEFQFPSSRGRFLFIIAKDILGFSILKMLKLLMNFSGAQQKSYVEQKASWARRTERVLYYAGVLSLLFYFNLMVPVLLLWFLPAFTLLFAILRVRNVAEHSNVGVQDDLEMARNILRPYWFERMTVGPHHVNLHLVHHFYPSVPFYSLPKVHRLLMGVPEYAARAANVDTYFGLRGSSVLNDIAVQRQNEMSGEQLPKPGGRAVDVLDQADELWNDTHNALNDKHAVQTPTAVG